MFVVGTGGIGSGMFLALHGDHLLGREESRAATLLDRQDAAKLHIVLHYVRRLGGAGTTALPIGLVGDDEPGRWAVARMRDQGLDISLVGTSTRPTLFSVCFQYPNGDGGNITTAGSASDELTARHILAARPRLTTPGTAIALPEVPLAAREALLDLATETGLRRVATFVSGEWPAARRLLDRVDLLAVNLDEAAAYASVDAATTCTADIVDAAVSRAGTTSLVVTAGRHGSWAWDGTRLSHAEPLDVTPVNTAGAGDAHLAAIVVALERGQDLAAANRYAAIVSGLSVCSPHTIAPDLTPARVRAAASAAGHDLPTELFPD